MRSRQAKHRVVNILWLCVAAVFACTSILAQTGRNQTIHNPTETPTPAVQVSAGDHLISPGKIDFQYRHGSLTDEYNVIWSSPVVKGGFGFTNSDNSGLTKYQGVFFRPLLPLHKKDDLIVGLQRVRTKNDVSWEFQTEYRFAFGLGVGGGFVRSSNHALRVSFAKTSYRKKQAGWNYILETQAQRVASKTSLGGYGRSTMTG